MRTYFDTESLKVGMIVEYDYSGGLNSCGVDYYLTKVTKTYVEGYYIIGNKRGNIKKFTKPKEIKKKVCREKINCGHIYECGCNKNYCEDCLIAIDNDEIIYCDDETCKHYYSYRNDNCNCRDNFCGFCSVKY
jgi:hypothetical protein